MILSTKLKHEKEGKIDNLTMLIFKPFTLFLLYCVFVKQGHCGVPYSRCGAQCHGSLSLHIPLMRDDLTFSVGHKQIQAVAKLPILF